jgi:hypothetical protein
MRRSQRLCVAITIVHADSFIASVDLISHQRITAAGEVSLTPPGR